MRPLGFDTRNGSVRTDGSDTTSGPQICRHRLVAKTATVAYLNGAVAASSRKPRRDSWRPLEETAVEDHASVRGATLAVVNYDVCETGADENLRREEFTKPTASQGATQEMLQQACPVTPVHIAKSGHE